MVIAKTFPGKRIHGNGHPSLGSPFLHGSAQLCFNHVLDLFVQGEDHIPVMLLLIRREGSSIAISLPRASRSILQTDPFPLSEASYWNSIPSRPLESRPTKPMTWAASWALG